MWISRGIEQFAAAAPKLNREVVECIVPIREGSKNGSVKTGRGVGEKARCLLEFFPGSGRGEFAKELRTEGGATFGIGKEVASVDEALRAVVPGQRGEMLAEDEWLDERTRPSLRPVVNRDVLLPGVQVFK